MRNRIESQRLPVGKAVAMIQRAFGWTDQRMSLETGISRMTISLFKSGDRAVSLKQVERIREVTMIDPYVLAYCLYYDSSADTEEIQRPLRELCTEWEKRMALMTKTRHLLPTSW